MIARETVILARERLAAARLVLRDRSSEQTLESLAALLDAWSPPDSPWQRRLVEELPAATGFSSANVREGLARALSHWSGAALRELVESELGPTRDRSTGFEQTSVVLAGSIPMPTILSLLMPLLLHSPVLAKTASRDPVTARVFAASLAEIDPELAAALAVVTFASSDRAAAAAFLDADCVVASGSDETLRAVGRQLRHGVRLVGYGHRLSLAVLGGEALTPEALPKVAEALALDVALWDQLGCLSPVALLCETSDLEPAEQLAEALAMALAKIEARLPRGELPVAVAAAIRSEREQVEMRRAGEARVSLRGPSDLRFTVIREADASWRPAPLHRFLRIHPCESRAALFAAVGRVGAHLAAAAVAGFGAEHESVAAELVRLGASRICEPGAMQSPAFGWHHDGEPLLPPLTIS